MENENFLNHDFITHSALMITAESYMVHGLYKKSSGKSEKIPQDSIANVGQNGFELITDLMTTSDNQLRMYGSPEELTQNLQVFRTFPSNVKVFDTCKFEPYNSVVIQYTGRPGTVYVYKQDVFMFLTTRLSYLDFHLDFDYLRAFMMLYVRHLEEKLPNGIHFVCSQDELMQELAFQAETKITPPNDIPPHMLYKNHCGLHEFIYQWRELLPESIAEKDFKPIADRLEKFYLSFHSDLEHMKMQYVFFSIQIVIKHISKIITKFPEQLSPDVCPNTGKHRLRILRLIVNGEDEYVMLCDLESLLNPASKLKKEKYMKAILKDEYESEYRLRLGFVEFVPVEIFRAKHRAVPILSAFGGHCIMAADSLFETLRDLFFGVQFFQKVEMEQWELVKTVFGSLEEFYNPKVETAYFLDYAEHRSIIKKILKSFPNIDTIPAKYVRNAKKDGFTLQNLKNELVHLGLNNVFPYISDFADLSYTRVEHAKRKECLRTCDLFDAIEFCQVSSVLKSFPFLAEFLHKQRFCNRLVWTCCSICTDKEKIIESLTRARLECRDLLPGFVKSEIEVVPDRNNVLLKFFTLVCPDGTKIHKTHSLFSSLWPNESFDYLNVAIIDSETVKLMQDLVRKQKTSTNPLSIKKQKEILQNDESLSKAFPMRKLYLRTVYGTAIDHDKNRRVFAIEAERIIECIFRNDNSLFRKNVEKWTSNKKKWQIYQGYRTIKLDEFWDTFDKLGINRKLITIVPDTEYLHLSTYIKYIEYGYTDVFLSGPCVYGVVSANQAIFMIYQTMVAEIDWRVNGRCKCGNPKKCKMDHKASVIKCMTSYADLEEGTFINKDDPKTMSEVILNSCNKISRQDMPLTPTVEFFGCDFGDTISLKYLIAKFKQFGFNDYDTSRITSNQLENTFVPVWKVRIIFLIKWLDLFFGDSLKNLKDIVMECILTKIPLIQKDKDPIDVLFSLDPKVVAIQYDLAYDNDFDIEVNQKFHPWVNNKVLNRNIKHCKKWLFRNFVRDCHKNVSYNSFDKVVLEAREKYFVETKAFYDGNEKRNKESIRKTNEIVRKVLLIDNNTVIEEAKQPTVEAKQPTVEAKQPTVEAKQPAAIVQCKKCTEYTTQLQNHVKTIESIKEEVKAEKEKCVTLTRKNLEADETILEMNKELNDAKKKLKELEKGSPKELARISKLEAAFQSSQKEIKDLKNEISKKDAEMRKKTSTMAKNENQLKEKASKIDQELKSTKTKVNQLKSQLEDSDKQKAEKTAEINELKKFIDQLLLENEKLSTSNNEKDQKIQDLIDEQRLREQFERQASCSSPPRTRLRPEVSNYILELHSIRNGLLRTNPAREVVNLVTRFNASSGIDANMMRGANLEKMKFAEQYEKYMKAVEQQIKTIQSNIEIRLTDLPPLPEFPEISADFMVVYERIKKREYEDRVEERKDCHICIESMRMSDETIKCHTCSIAFHTPCIQEWFKTSKSCPICKAEMNA